MSTAQGTAPEESVRRRGTSPALIAVLVIIVWIATTWGSQLLTGATTGWRAPSTEDFQFEGWFGTTWFTKPLLLALVAFVGILAFWLIAAHRQELVRRAQVHAQVERRENGTYTVELSLSDDVDNVMHLQLMVATKEMADDLAQRFQRNPEQVYSQLVTALYGG